jgi:hypothetical protein
MNANELADELEDTYPFMGVMEVAAIKLRQQQESIEGLNRDYDLLFAEHQLLLKKEWVELTTKEILQLWLDMQSPLNRPEFERHLSLIQNKLKEKNT